MDHAIYVFATLFVTIGPIDVASLFIAISFNADAASRRQMAVRGTAVGAGVLLIFALAGEALLDALGITMPAFRFAGGILLLLLAIDMVFARHSGISGLTSIEGEEASSKQDISIFPLAVPLIAGPGAIASVILLMGEVQGELTGQLTVLLVLVVVLLLTLAALLLAGRIVGLFGITGVNVITRVLGIVLAALAAQYILDGLARSGVLGTGGAP
ncbi:MAG: MarC family protein [Candidatus Competibacteraceae bacterium]|nr:MarC family protein [Candidatus Competibacteraceae bacterium]